MEKNQVEEIMQIYNKQEKEVTKVGENTEYLNKLDEIKTSTIENNKTKLHLERLEEELLEVTDESLKQEYNRQIAETKKQLSEETEKIEVLNQEKEKMIIEKKKNEREIRKAIKDKMDLLQDATRKELMAKKKELELEAQKARIAHETVKLALAGFKYEYDEKGNPTNGEVFSNMQENLVKTFQSIQDFEEMAKKCEEYRKTLIDPYKMPEELPDDKIYSANILKEVAKEEIKVEQDQSVNDKVENNEEKQAHEKAEGKVITKSNNETEKFAKKIEDSYKKLNLKDEKVYGIDINEKDGIVTIIKEGYTVEASLEKILAGKKETFKDLDIRNICNEIAGGKIKGLLLGTKVNPAIVYALKENPDMVKTYIECLKEEKKLPFELTHDLRESKLGLLNKMKMWIHAKGEDKIPGTKVNFATRNWNKNRALPFPTKLTTVPEKDTDMKNIKEEYKVDNKDNKIEKVASKIMDETEKEMASEVKNMKKDDNEMSK